MKKRTIYIAGPITGVDRYWEPFEKAEDELIAAGFIPLSPARLPEGMAPAQYMRICLAVLDSADAALFLPGWTESKGAMLEYRYCQYTGKRAVEAIGKIGGEDETEDNQ